MADWVYYLPKERNAGETEENAGAGDGRMQCKERQIGFRGMHRDRQKMQKQKANWLYYLLKERNAQGQTKEDAEAEGTLGVLPP